MAWRRTPSGAQPQSQPNTRNRTRSNGDVEKNIYNEKESYSDGDDHNSTPPSNQPMLAQAYSSPSSARSKFTLRVPHSRVRLTCWGLAVTLIIFVLTLMRASHNEDVKVKEMAAEQKIAPRPPMWETFRFLSRYWGGIRTLVPYSDNVPEWPGDNDFTSSINVTEERMAGRKRWTIPDSLVFSPYPNYTSPDYVERWGAKVDCFLDAAGKVSVPQVRMYEGRQSGFPEPAMGSATVLGMRHDICYDRYGRLGPYGLGYSLAKGGSGAMQEGDREGSELVWSDVPEVDYRGIKWAEVQDRCFQNNSHRFNAVIASPAERFRTMQVGVQAKRAEIPEKDVKESKDTKDTKEPKAAAAAKDPKPDAAANPKDPKEPTKETTKEVAKEKDSKEEKTSSLKDSKETSDEVKSTSTKKGKLPRTAVVIRTWSDYDYTPEDILYLRSIITELMLHSGGEYTIHFLIQVKDNYAPIFSDEEMYEKILLKALPEEFRGMGTLWSEGQMALMYPGLSESMVRNLPVHGVYRSTFMPMQYFAYQHPEYDYFWNWEMDARNTGHWYHLFDTVSKWARAQPRKLLWERNGRYYVRAQHGTWDDFSHMVRIQTEQGTNSANNLWSGLKSPDKNGVGNTHIQGDKPIWGPEHPKDDDVSMKSDPEPPTTFEKDQKTWGVGEEADLIAFNPLFDPEGTTWLLSEDVTGYKTVDGNPPRRAAIITASRISRRLLMTMHRETSQKRHTMFSEMWPATAALHHGLKAVFAPHPVYVDRRWPVPYLEQTFNAGRNGATGGTRTSVFGEREHNFRGTTWYYNAGFSEVLWHRWLGMRIHNDGGEVWEMGNEGRMCLPGMLLHPIKRVELPQEGKRAD